MDDRAERSLSLVIPAYNEAAGIAAAIAEADDALAALTTTYEVLIVDDGSSDTTFAAASEAARERPNVRVLQHTTNRGYGAALRTGFEAARCDLVAFTDADCQFHLADLQRLLPLTDKHPVVVGYRIDRQDPWLRRFYSWGYNVLTRTLLGTRVRDVDCALKVFCRRELCELLPESRGFFVNTEMLTRARQADLAVAEVGVRHRPRLRGSSKVSLADIPRTLRSLLPFWWTQVLFPNFTSRDDLASGAASARRCVAQHRRADAASLANLRGDLGLWIVLLIAGLLFFGRLGAPLQEPQEPRYAEIPRQMLAEGRFTVPVLHGQAYYDKPPLLYWLVMASYSVFGVHDWAARLVPCLAGFLCIGVTYWWGRRTAGPRAAFAGALILCLSGRFIQLERMLTMDGLLCLWIVTALATAHVALTTAGATRWWLLSALACGLGFLTKGPVTLVLVAVPLLGVMMLDPRLNRPNWRIGLLYLAVSIGVAAPWYLSVIAQDAQFAEYFFWDQNVRRYLTPFDHQEPSWFYLPGLVLGLLSWSLLLPALGYWLCRRSAPVARRRPAALGLFLLCFAWSLGFFSLAGCKRPAYILPALPPLALALGCYLDVMLPNAGGWRPSLGWLSYRSIMAYRATVLALVFGLGGALTAAVCELVRPMTGLCLSAVALAGLAAVHLAGRRRPGLPWGACAATTFLVLLTALHQVLPGYARRFSMRGQVRRYAAASTPVVCYPHRWDSVSFYLQRDDVQVYTPERRDRLIADLRRWPETLVYVKSENWLKDLLRHLPPELEFVPDGRQGCVSVGWVRARSG
jgi:dolichol-phosphate mannosyltransferase